MINHDGNFKLTSQTFVGNVNLTLLNRHVTIYWISVVDYIRNVYIGSIQVVQWYTIGVWEEVIMGRVWCAMS